MGEPLRAENHSEGGKRAKEKDESVRSAMRARSARQRTAGAARVRACSVSTVSTNIYHVYGKSKDTVVCSLADMKKCGQWDCSGFL